MSAKNFHNGPVVPIPPFYFPNENLNISGISTYASWLVSNGIKVLMTTAGTSQFNLLDLGEIRKLNIAVVQGSMGANVILGIPALSTRATINEIKYYSSLFFGEKRIALMLLYPDRFYEKRNNNSISDFFDEVSQHSCLDLFIHGLPIRSGKQGVVEITHENINRLPENIIGMKEESSSFDNGYKLIYETKRDFIFIVAGRSQRRFLLLNNVGAQTFLSGMGNFIPKYEIDFFNAVKNNDQTTINKMMEYENFVFKIADRSGWHLFLRGMLKEIGFDVGNRKPFPTSYPIIGTKIIKKKLGLQRKKK